MYIWPVIVNEENYIPILLYDIICVLLFFIFSFSLVLFRVLPPQCLVPFLIQLSSIHLLPPCDVSFYEYVHMAFGIFVGSSSYITAYHVQYVHIYVLPHIHMK